jgi:HPt (histidine-containing phosphotransfer) domain-containing protein
MLRVPKGWLMVVKMMIDWERTNELCAEIGSDGFAEIVELFLDEVEGVVRRLSKQPDPSRFEADLHFLKGGAWNLGFAAFGALCQDGEREAAGGRPDEVDAAKIVAAYYASKAEFMAGLAALGERDGHAA